jgi:signal recognition particle subunit SRP54
MFEGLAEKLQTVLQGLKNKGRLTEKDIDATLREVKVVLLEADVNFKVARDLVAGVREKALGNEVLRSLTPGRQVIAMVHRELTSLLGGMEGKASPIARPPLPPARVMLVGLQGAGKTTTAAKLAVRLRKEGRNPYLIPADFARPAAVLQLLALADRAGVAAYRPPAGDTPLSAWKAGELAGVREGADALILDTAGRSHVDEELLREAGMLASAVLPHETLLVVDAMTGQDAVRTADEFARRLPLTGIILAKTEGDARGGAALSMRAVTGLPVRFAGTGEGLDDLEAFHPERAASRILGMGDVLTLIEKAQAAAAGEEEEAAASASRALTGGFDLSDFRDQLRRMARMGPMGEMLKMLPLPGRIKDALPQQAPEQDVTRIIAIIDSMTAAERRRPEVLNGGRRRRIAAGSGTTVQEVNRLIRQFDAARAMMKAAGRRGDVVASFHRP